VDLAGQLVQASGQAPAERDQEGLLALQRCLELGRAELDRRLQLDVLLEEGQQGLPPARLEQTGLVQEL